MARWTIGRVLRPALAVVLCAGAVACGGQPGASTEDQIAPLAAADTDFDRAVVQYEEEISALRDQLSRAESDRDEALAQLDQALEQLTDADDTHRLELEVAQLASELTSTQEELEAARLELASVPAPSPTAPSPVQPSAPAPQSGCSAGQVDINSASESELQRIHQIGPARAKQFPSLRPFSSVADLIRVKGIGQSHLAAIKEQGVACVA